MSTDTKRTNKRGSRKPLDVKTPTKSRSKSGSNGDDKPKRKSSKSPSKSKPAGTAKNAKSKKGNSNGNGKKKKGKKKENLPKPPKKEGQTVLRIKLGRPYGMPERAFHRLLHNASWACVLSRHAALMTWYRWKIQNPDWKPGDYYDAPPRRQKVRKGYDEHDLNTRGGAMAPKTLEDRTMYYAACDESPMLAPAVKGCCSREVVGKLKTKTRWDHRGNAKWLWQMPLLHEGRMLSFTNTYSIPLPPNNIVLTYTEDECKVRLKMLDKHSGWKNNEPEVRLLVGDMTNGHRRILRKLVNKDELIPKTSYVTFVENGKTRKDARGKYPDGNWFLCLTYKTPTNAVDCPKERQLVVEPCGGEDDRPFRAYWTDEGGEERSWGIGNGRPYLAQCRRADDKRRAIRSLPRKGHGCRKQASRGKMVSRYMSNLYPKFREQIARDITRLAIRERCGTVVYRKPSEPVKDMSWFAENNAYMNWEDLNSKIERKCLQIEGLHYHVVRVYKKEWITRNKSRKVRKEAEAAEANASSQ